MQFCCYTKLRSVMLVLECLASDPCYSTLDAYTCACVYSIHVEMFYILLGFEFEQLQIWTKFPRLSTILARQSEPYKQSLSSSTSMFCEVPGSGRFCAQSQDRELICDQIKLLVLADR